MKKRPGTNLEKEEIVARAKERRVVIIEIMRTKGFKSVYELKRILKDDYNIDIAFENVYNDLRYIDAFKDEDLKVFNNEVLACCRSHLENLNKIAENGKYDNHKVLASRNYFVCAKEMLHILKLMKETKVRSPDEIKEEVKILEEEKEDVEIKFE